MDEMNEVEKRYREFRTGVPALPPNYFDYQGRHARENAVEASAEVEVLERRKYHYRVEPKVKRYTETAKCCGKIYLRWRTQHGAFPGTHHEVCCLCRAPLDYRART